MRTGRILVNAATAGGAGRDLQQPHPDVSLGCGSWGGSSTTENVNYLQLLNLKTVSRRRTPPQWFRVPANTYFNAGALENLRDLEYTDVVVVSTRSASTGWWDLLGPSFVPATCGCSARSSRSRTRRRSAAAWSCSTGCGPTCSSRAEAR